MVYFTVNFTAVRNQRFFYLCAGSRILRRLVVAVGIDLPEIFIQIEFRQCFDQFHIGFPIRFDGAYILPVSTEAISVEGLAFFQHFRNDVFPEIAVGMDGIVLNERFTQSAPCEDINPHGCQIALWIFGFFFEFIDLVVFFCVHDTKAARFFHGHFQNGNGCCRAFFLSTFVPELVI